MRESRLWFRESNGKWYTTIGGQQKCLGPSKKEAEKKLRELLARGITTDPPVLQLFNQFLAFVEANRAADTFIKYRRHLLPFAKLGRSLRVSRLQPLHVQRILDSDYKGASTTTHNDVITVVKTALNWAVGQGYIAFNPLAKMPKPARNVRETFVPASEWPRLVAAISDPQFRDYVLFALHTGARPQETRKIEASHLQGSKVVFPRLQSKGKKRQRVIYLDDVALAIVQRLAAEHPEGPIFRNTDGGPWSKNAILCRFKRLRTKLKMPGLCATVLRHSYAHNKLVEKTDSLIVSKLLGHRDGQMLATRYGHVEESGILEAEAKRSSPLPLPVEGLPPLESGPGQPV